jgi:hypothetical protein
LNQREAVLFAGRDIADLEHIPSLHTRRERGCRRGQHTTIFFDAAELRQVFRVADAQMKLALLECSMWQLRREFSACTNTELMRWIGECLILRSTCG